MICPNCGKEYNNKILFCISCGTTLVKNEEHPDLKSDSTENADIDIKDIPEISVLNEPDESEIPDNNNYESIPEIVPEDDKTADNNEKSFHETSPTGSAIGYDNISDSNDMISDTPVITDSLYKISSIYEYDIILPNESIEPAEKDTNSNQQFKANILRKKSEKKVPLGIKMLRNVASFVLAILIFVFSFIASFTFSARQLMNEDSVTEFVDSADILNLSVTEFCDTSDYTFELDENATVLDAIYGLTKSSGISRSDIELIYNNSTFKSFLTENLSGYTEYITTGSSPRKITPEMIKNLYTENIDLLNETLDTELTDTQINKAFSEIDKSDDVLEAFSVKSIENGHNANYFRLFRALVSLPALIIEIALLLGLIVLIFAMQKKFSSSLGWSGIPLCFSGITIIITTFLISSRLILYYELNEFERMLASGAMSVASKNMYTISIALLLVGILCVFWSHSINNFKKNSGLKIRT